MKAFLIVIVLEPSHVSEPLDLHPEPQAKVRVAVAGTVTPEGTVMVRTPSLGIGNVGVNSIWYCAFTVPTPSVLATMLAVPAVLGNDDVTIPPAAGLPLTLFARSNACSTSYKVLLSEVTLAPREFLIFSVKPVSKVEITGYSVTLIVILSDLFFAVKVGPPELRAHNTVSSFHNEPAW